MSWRRVSTFWGSAVLRPSPAQEVLEALFPKAPSDVWAVL
jgi:hypothetical protein